MSKKQTLQQLNEKLKLINEEKSTLSNIGKVVVGGGIYNAKQITDNIPVKATGKIGHTYFQDRDYDRADQNMHTDLQGILKKMRHNKLEEQGITIHQKNKNDLKLHEHNDAISGLQYDLFEQNNPHYKKLFDPDYFYKINDSDSEDELTKQQRQEVELLYYSKQVPRSKKINILNKLNKFKEKKEEHDHMQDSINKQNEERDRALQNILYKNNISSNKKKGILKNSSFHQQNSNIKNNGRSITFQEDSNTSEPTEYDDLVEIKKDKIPKWKLASEAFRAAMKPSKDRSFKENELINEAMHNKQMVYCEYCKRKFTELAAEKHIPICKDRQLTIQKKTPRRKKINFQK